MADFAQTYVTLERAATEIRYYDAELVFGLLQSERYARAVLANSRSQHVEERTADRVARQTILTRENPPDVRVILGEAALHRMVGGKEALREQVAELLAKGRLPNVAIRVLPFAAGAHRALSVGSTSRMRPPSWVDFAGAVAGRLGPYAANRAQDTSQCRRSRQDWPAATPRMATPTA